MVDEISFAISDGSNNLNSRTLSHCLHPEAAMV